jgi:hypothetical protein
MSKFIRVHRLYGLLIAATPPSRFRLNNILITATTEAMTVVSKVDRLKGNLVSLPLINHVDEMRFPLNASADFPVI